MLNERMYSENDRMVVQVEEFNNKLEQARLQGEQRMLEQVIRVLEDARPDFDYDGLNGFWQAQILLQEKLGKNV